MSISSKTTPFSLELLSLAGWAHWRTFIFRQMRSRIEALNFTIVDLSMNLKCDLTRSNCVETIGC